MKRLRKIASALIVVTMLSGCAIQQATLEKQAEDRQAVIDAKKAKTLAPVKKKHLPNAPTSQTTSN